MGIPHPALVKNFSFKELSFIGLEYFFLQSTEPNIAPNCKGKNEQK